MQTFLKMNVALMRALSLSSVKYGARNINTTAVVYQPRSLVKMKKLQADYQIEDGKPIFLKGGFCDRILYTTTLVGALVGVGLVFLTIFEHAKPPSWRESSN